MKIYLDVCCLNRLFDDQRHIRIAAEAMAILRILQLLDYSTLTDYSSEMAQLEIERIPNHDRRLRVTALLPPQKRIIPLSNELLDNAERLSLLGFDVADAVHLAAAECLGVDFFLSVDDRLLRRAKQHAKRFMFRVLNPIAFLEEHDDAVNG